MVRLVNDGERIYTSTDGSAAGSSFSSNPDVGAVVPSSSASIQSAEDHKLETIEQKLDLLLAAQGINYEKESVE